MKIRTLKDEHPLKRKFDLLMSVAEEIGIEFSFENMVVSLKDSPESAYFLDAEDLRSMGNFPPITEYKLVLTGDSDPQASVASSSHPIEVRSEPLRLPLL